MKKLPINFVAFCAASLAVQAAPNTSYLMIQGPFGSNGASQTFDWRVTYDPGQLSTGQDLLNAVLGTPVANGSYTYYPYNPPPYNAVTYPYFSVGNVMQGWNYYYYSSPYFSGAVLESITLNGTNVAQDISLDPGWNYYAAGGSGVYQGGSYLSGSWNLSNDGVSTRTIANGSFDGYVFGPTGYNGWTGTFEDVAAIVGDENAPVAANFSSASLVKVDSENLTLTGAQDYDSLTVSGGTTNLDGPLGTGASTINANATLNISASQTLAALNIGEGATGSAGSVALATPEPCGIALLMLGAATLIRGRRRLV